MEVDQGYKVTTVGTQPCSADNNQAQIFVLQSSFSCRLDHPCVKLISSVGSALEWKFEGRGFESLVRLILHLKAKKYI